jgi:hypothetical protein
MTRNAQKKVSTSAPAAGQLTSTRRLLGGTWAACVDAVETAMWRFKAEHPLASDCNVAFFEVAADETLHINVTHQHVTRAISGWAGPGRTSDGFVHNRIFAPASKVQVVRHVRDMVFAGPA